MPTVQTMLVVPRQRTSIGTLDICAYPVSAVKGRPASVRAATIRRLHAGSQGIPSRLPARWNSRQDQNEAIGPSCQSLTGNVTATEQTV